MIKCESKSEGNHETSDFVPIGRVGNNTTSFGNSNVNNKYTLNSREHSTVYSLCAPLYLAHVEDML